MDRASSFVVESKIDLIDKNQLPQAKVLFSHIFKTIYRSKGKQHFIVLS